MRPLGAFAVTLVLAAGAQGWQPNGWLGRLQQVAAARERRPVRLALVSDRDIDWERTSDYGLRAVLRDPAVRARVFGTGSIGYTFIPPRPKPVCVFVNSDRVESELVRLVAAHEIGHVLLHARGYLQIVVPPGSRGDEPLLADSFNAIQDVLLERELLDQRVDSQPLLARQMRLLVAAVSGGGSAAAPDVGHLNISHLATMATPLLAGVRGMEAEKQSLRNRLPPEAVTLVTRYLAILRRPINGAADYREAIYLACEANGLARARVRFADD